MCRYGDVLYVTEVTKDSLLTEGDKIIEINGASVKAFYEKYEECFYKEMRECQTLHWNLVLKYADEIQRWKEELFDWDSTELQYSFRRINLDVVYLKFADFVDSTSLSLLLQEHDLEICNTKI